MKNGMCIGGKSECYVLLDWVWSMRRCVIAQRSWVVPFSEVRAQGRVDLRCGYQEFYFGHVKFEMPARYPRDVMQGLDKWA